ncbi:MAG: hypothetical protein KGZ74_17710 [Chitinophagaceae bacterium]|nr:hypothetical protein [Chitinophagaceae bacterium]
MHSKFTIQDEAYAAMLEYLDKLFTTEQSGIMEDAFFINEDFWLQDTAVVENVECRNGEWNIYLVFAHHLMPLKFIKRKIVNYCCPKKAALASHYMRRQAAKDQRGTLQINPTLFATNFN